MIGLAVILRCPELDLVWIPVFVSVILNCLKSPEKIITSVLETKSSTCYMLQFGCRCTIKPIESLIAFVSVLLKRLQKRGHTLVLARKDEAFADEDAGLIYFSCFLKCFEFFLSGVWFS